MTSTERRLVNEGPTVVGLMTSVIESGGSLDTAVRTVAVGGPRISGTIFDKAVRSADTKQRSGIKDALAHSLSDAVGEASGYRQAVLLCVSASESSDPAERLRILEDASDIAIDAVRIMGERYSASLSSPCMAIFALGIMAPMILMSILPMMGIGGLFGEIAIDENLIIVTTLILIPVIISALAWKIRSGNPFITEKWKSDPVPILLVLSSVPMALLLYLLGSTAAQSVSYSVIVASVCAALLLYPGVKTDTSLSVSLDGMKNCILELGNSLLGGGNFEESSVSVMSARAECADTGMLLGRELDLCRGNTASAVERAISPISPEVSRTMVEIHRCSLQNIDDAGRLAIAVGRQFQNESDTRRELSIHLKSMTDMMTGTAAVFAPMILGLSVSMMGPLGEISGYAGMERATVVLSVYLVELCALISVLISGLGEGTGVRGTVWKFCIMAPISLIVFTICSMLQLRRY